MVRKVKKEYENPIDNILYDLCEIISPTFYKFGFTPNIITLLSFVTTLFSLNYFMKNLFYKGCLLLWLSYFFDCLDGHVARKYKMTSKIGDYLDHGSDLFLSIGLIYVLYKKNPWKIFQIKLGIMLLIGVFIFLHLGCQEKIYNKESESPTLSYSKKLCREKSWIRMTRWFGTGTMIGVICLLIKY